MPLIKVCAQHVIISARKGVNLLVGLAVMENVLVPAMATVKKVQPSLMIQ